MLKWSFFLVFFFKVFLGLWVVVFVFSFEFFKVLFWWCVDCNYNDVFFWKSFFKGFYFIKGVDVVYNDDL